MVVKARNRWFQDVRRRSCSVRNAPAAVLVQQGRLCLGSGKTELAIKRLAEPGGRIGFQFPEAFCDFVVSQPCDVAGPADGLLDEVRQYEADSACAIRSYGGRQERERR